MRLNDSVLDLPEGYVAISLDGAIVNNRMSAFQPFRFPLPYSCLPVA